MEQFHLGRIKCMSKIDRSVGRLDRYDTNFVSILALENFKKI